MYNILLLCRGGIYHVNKIVIRWNFDECKSKLLFLYDGVRL